MNTLTNEQANEEFHREQKALEEERSRYEITPEQLDTILGELLETIDRYFIESAFNFRTNLSSSEGNWGDHPFLNHFVDALNPYLKYLQKKLQTALKDKYPANRPGEPDADLTRAVYNRGEYAYVVGLFVGARLAGASDARMEALRKYLII